MVPNAPALIVATSFAFLAVSPNRAASLTGTVRDQTDAPIPQVIALLQSHVHSEVRYVLRTDEKGIFRFFDTLEGAYSLELLKAGFKRNLINSIAPETGEHAVPQTFVLEVGEPGCGRLIAPLFDIRLVPPGGRTGYLAATVKDTRHRPLSGVTVLLICADQAKPCGSGKTNSRGEFNFRLVPGSYRIRVLRHGFYAAPAQEVTVRVDLEMIYYPIVLERCANGNCDPRFRPAPPFGDPSFCF